MALKPRQLVTVPVKPISESKTLWINGLTLVLGILVWFGVVNPADWGQERLDGIVGTILSIVGAVNMIMRMFFTSAPLTTNTKTPGDV